MFGHAIQLVRRAMQKQRSDGLRSLLDRVRYHLITKQLQFQPVIPPLAIEYKNTRYSLSHKDKYININSQPKVTPSAGDTVIEAGVCRGLDTAMFAKLADRVIGFEPSPRNYDVAQHNLNRFGNVELVNSGLWNEADTLEIQYGESGSEDGFITPDSGLNKTGGKVPVNTLTHYVEALEQLTYDKNGMPDKESGLDHITDAGTYFIEYEMPIQKKQATVKQVSLH